MATESQNLRNHTRLVPGYHYVTFLFAAVFVVWSIVCAVRAPGLETLYPLIASFGMIGIAWYARVFALQAQNRVIRLEERLRLARLLPADLQQHIDAIQPSQLIALRFASDGELTELTRKAIANPAMSAKEIKAAITHWRPDHYRV